MCRPLITIPSACLILFLFVCFSSPARLVVLCFFLTGSARRARANAHAGRFDFYLTPRTENTLAALRARRRSREADNGDGDEDDTDQGAAAAASESGDDDDDEPRDVLVQFGMTEAGELRVKVLDDDFCDDVIDGGSHDGRTRDEAAMQTFLMAAVAVLGLLYLALRLFLRPITDHGDAATPLFSQPAAERAAFRGEAEL